MPFDVTFLIVFHCLKLLIKIVFSPNFCCFFLKIPPTVKAFPQMFLKKFCCSKVSRYRRTEKGFYLCSQKNTAYNGKTLVPQF